MTTSIRRLTVLLSTFLLGCASSAIRPPADVPAAEAPASIPVRAARFSSVVAVCTCYVNIIVGPTHRVEVKAHKELVDGVKVDVEDGVLTLQYYPTSVEYAREPVQFEITVPELEMVDARVVTHLSVTGVRGVDDFSVVADGASHVALDGAVHTLHAELHGRATLDAQKLDATDVDITIDGRGEADVQARELLRASVYRFGKVRYHVEPAALEVTHGRRRVKPG